MGSYNNKIQIVFWQTESIEVGLPEITDIFGTTRYLHTCKYHGLQNMLIGSWDI
jgi:hypothetical protein